MVETILFVLIMLMIVGAIIAIETPSLLHSVIAVGAVGFLLSIVFLFLSAPDLAITQLAVEVITLALLLQATRRSDTDTNADRWFSFTRLAALAVVTGLALLSARMFVEFPEFGQPVMDRIVDAPSNHYLRNGLQETGAANIVTAVLLDYRAYDTLGEATILFCAAMGAISVLRRKAEPKHGEPIQEDLT